MVRERIPQLQTLSTAEKFALAIELWDEVASDADEIPVTDEQLNELDRRFGEYKRNPDNGRKDIWISQSISNGTPGSAVVRRS